MLILNVLLALLTSYFGPTSNTFFILKYRRNICKVIDIPVDIGTLHELSHAILGIAKNKSEQGAYVCVANVHMLTIARSQPSFRSVLENASLVLPDGMPLVWSQKLKGFHNAERVCGPDVMLELCKLANSNNESIYLLGSSRHTLDLLSGNLIKSFPGLVIAGTYSPTMLSEKPSIDQALIENINDSGASIIFVGLGCPKQEYWCAAYAPHLNGITIGVGAAFDFHAGTKKRPPHLVQKMGFEWLYRLLSEPRRLWKRYLVTNTYFLYYSLIDFFK